MCSCLDSVTTMSNNDNNSGHVAGSYQRLGEGPDLFEYTRIMQMARREAASHGEENVDNERQVRC